MWVWEGEIQRLTWLSSSDNSYIINTFITTRAAQVAPPSAIKDVACAGRDQHFRGCLNKSFQGPHNLNIISLIVGSLLSNSYLEKRESGSIRVVFIKYSNNVEYLINFYSVFALSGYCNLKRPRIYKLIGKGNRVFFLITFKTYSFTNLDWLFDLFYIDNLKIIPREILLDKYFTPLALTTLFLSSSFDSLKIAGLHQKAVALLGKEFILGRSLVSVKYSEYLSFILKNKYNIETIIKFNNKSCLAQGVSLYIKNSNVFSLVVKPYLLGSQINLLNRSTLRLNLFGSPCTMLGTKHLLHTTLTYYLNKTSLSYFISVSQKITKKDLSDIKYTSKYKKEFELSLEQKEALIGITSTKLYSTLGISVNSEYLENNLNKYFITGFIDAKGCFRVKISKSKERKIGWVIEPIFQIGLNQKDLVILQLIQKTFNGAGSIN